MPDVDLSDSRELLRAVVNLAVGLGEPLESIAGSVERWLAGMNSQPESMRRLMLAAGATGGYCVVLQLEPDLTPWAGLVYLPGWDAVPRIIKEVRAPYSAPVQLLLQKLVAERERWFPTEDDIPF